MRILRIVLLSAALACVCLLVATTVWGQDRSRENWPEWTNIGSKNVPILSVGTPGLQLGVAQVTGPKGRVERVRAVFQLDAEFQRLARVRAFIPSESMTSLGRVQGVAVSGLLQYQVMHF